MASKAIFQSDVIKIRGTGDIKKMIAITKNK